MHQDLNQPDGHPLTDIEKYKIILDNIHDLICEIDEDGIYTFVNHQYEKILGYKPEELLGRRAIEQIHPDDLQESIKRHSLIKDTLENSVDFWRFRDKNGEFRLIEAKGTVYVNKDGKRRTVVISRDITHQKQVEKALSDSESKYRRLHQSLMDGFVFVSMEGMILEYNDTYHQMLGYSDEELKSLTYQDITPVKWHAMEAEIVQNHLLIKNYSPVYQKEYQRKDGTIFPVELRTFLVRNENNESEGMWAIVRDISERKRYEQELLQLNQQLKELNNTKDKLFTIIAHDLRSPFNTIIGYTDLLAAQPDALDPKKIEEYLYRISSTARNTHFLLENLLTWAQSQTGQLEFNPEILHLKSTFRQPLATHKASARLKNIHIETDESLDDDVYADARMLKVILGNLLSNSIKFSNPGAHISIRLYRHSSHAEIRIIDTGVGMDQNTLHSIFSAEKLQPLPLDSGHSGLGLIICREFIERHKGSIKALSEPGKGTEIILNLPFKVSS